MAILSKISDIAWIQNLNTFPHEWVKGLNLSPLQYKLFLIGEGVGATLLAILAYRWLSTPRNLPPGPIGFPIIGAAHLIGDNAHLDYMDLAKTYGDIFSYYMYNRLTIVLSSYDIIKEVYVTRGSDFANRNVPVIEEVMGVKDELFAANYSEEWVKRKKFTFKALRAFGFATKTSEGMMQSEISELVKYMEDQDNKAFDLHFPLQKALINVIVKILFNQRYETGDEELNFLANAMDGMGQFFSEDLLKYLLIPTWARKLFRYKMGPMGVAPYQSVAVFVRNKIEEHRKNYKQGDPPHDFLDMHFQEGDNIIHDDERFTGVTTLFTPDAIGTLCAQLQWALFYVTLHQEVQQKAHAEIDAVCGSQLPSFDHRPDLNYLQAIVLETLRCSSVFLLLFPHRTVNGPKTIRGYNIPENADIFANVHGAHHDPRLFPEPEKFKPERWIEGDGGVEKTDKIISFGMGRRLCMGEQQAKSEH